MGSMSDEYTSFQQARARLEEIVSQVRKKDTSLEQALDLLEEGVRLANACTERSDQIEWPSVFVEATDEAEEGFAEPEGNGGSSGTDDRRAVGVASADEDEIALVVRADDRDASEEGTAAAGRE